MCKIQCQHCERTFVLWIDWIEHNATHFNENGDLID